MSKYLKTRPGSLEDNYQQMFKKELEKTGKSLAQMSDDEKKKFFNKIDSKHKADNEAVNPYAVGMAVAKKMKKDEPPLEKSTIKKAHDIAKSIKKDQKEALDPQTMQNMRDKISKITQKMNTLNKDNPENKDKVATMQANIDATKAKMKELQAKDAKDRTKTEEVDGDKKMSYKDMKKKTMTDKPKTPVDVNPKVEYK